MKNFKKQSIVSGLIVLSVLIAFTGCMNVRSGETISALTVPKEKFENKTIAILPVKQQSALSTDSLLSLKAAINEKLDDKVKEKLSDSKIIDTKKSVNALNEKDALDNLDSLMKTYDNTGAFDKKSIDTLCGILKSDYLVFSRLKAEKMSIAIVGKGFAASLEVAIISKATHDVVWSGSGEFKRGGMMGFGGTENKEAADELIRLAFESF